MNYSFTKINEKFPKKVTRSPRLDKKLHINKFAETLISITFEVGSTDTQYEDQLIDAMYEHDPSMFVFSKSDETNILTHASTWSFSTKAVEKYCTDLLTTLSEIDPAFATADNITVQYGDAYYGEW